MFSKRELSILSIIMNQAKGITGKQIADFMKVSDRTIRNDIAGINGYLKPYDCRISSSKVNGYYVTMEDRNILQEICQADQASQVDNEDRLFVILGIMFFHHSPIAIEDLADQLFVSDQTIYRDLNRLQNLLLIEYSMNAIDIKGNLVHSLLEELQVRMLFFRLSKAEILKTKAAIPLHLKLLTNDRFQETAFHTLMAHIKQCYQAHEVVLSSDSLYMLTWAIYFTLLRNQEANVIEQAHAQETDVTLMLDLIQYLQKKDYLLYELDQMLLQSYMKTLGMMKSNQKIIVIAEETKKIMYEFSEEIFRKYDFDINGATELYDNILLHIDIMIHRLKEDLQLINPILDDVKSKYPYAYEIAMLVVPILYKYEGKYLIDDEISYIAIYLQYYLELADTKLRAVLVSGSGTGITNLLRQWIMRHFSDKLEGCSCIPSYEVESYLAQHTTDLILSTVPLKGNQRDIVYINGIPGALDKENITDAIYKITMERKLQSAIEHVFQGTFVKRFQKSVSFETAINELSLLLYQDGVIANLKSFVQCVIDREQVYPTRVNESLMIPHPLKEMAKRDAVAIGLLEQGTNDHPDTRCILLLALNSTKNQDLEVLFRFIHLLANDEKNMTLLLQSNQTNLISNLMIIAERNPQ